jgi:hypothetical protein
LSVDKITNKLILIIKNFPPKLNRAFASFKLKFLYEKGIFFLILKKIIEAATETIKLITP